MPLRPHAHLMLPSPLGLLEYDVLEDAVFLGPGPKGALRAGASPFRGALVALTRSPEGFVARPLPGVKRPLINGEAVDEKVLVDGDRIRVAEHVAMFRTERGLVKAPAAPPAAPPGQDSGAGRRSSAPSARRASTRGRNPALTMTVLAALAILLAATYRTATHLKAIQSAKLSETELPELGVPVPADMSRPSRELQALHQLEQRNPEAYADLTARYQAFIRAAEGKPEADSAEARIRELTEAWSHKARAEMDATVKRQLGAEQYAHALQAVRQYEVLFGTMPAADDLDGVRRSIRMQARTAMSALIAKAGPLIVPQPRVAHRMLLGVTHQFPADMSAEVVGMLERCVGRMVALQAKRRRNGGRRKPREEPEQGGGFLPPFPGTTEPKDPESKDPESRDPESRDPESGPPPAGPTPNQEEASRDAQAKDAWAAARELLLVAKYAEALQSYTIVIQQYGNTAYYRTHKGKIMAGRRAAKVGALGPEGLVNVPATTKKGRLEFEYDFNDQRVFEADFSLEQPFSSEMPVQGKWARGSVLLQKATGLLHRLVFLPDVRIEADVVVQQPHDFGLMAVEESDDYRAVLFNIANTKFKLKKGAAARVNPGHLLWYIGQGVWSAADKDVHGFIKIAERSSSKLKGGDRLKIDFTRRKNSVEASFQGKTDGVHLEGRVRGDDGSTMGPGRVGLFTNSGIIVVNSVRISGVVDMEWFRKEMAFLVASDPGPPSGND